MKILTNNTRKSQVEVVDICEDNDIIEDDIVADDFDAEDEYIYRSYRQGGDRYTKLTDGEFKDKVDFQLIFDDNIAIFARKIWDTLQLSRRFNNIKPSEIFNNNYPLNIEIGFGNGEFLTTLAQNNSNENFLGLEVFKKVFVKAFKKIKREDLGNCKIIQFDAALIIRLLPDNSVSKIYVNFPDPWFKTRHKKRRLLKPFFIELLCNKLISGGVLNIATDHDDYAKEIAKNISAVDGLKSIHDTPYIRKLENYLPTKYYRKFVSDDGAYFFQYKKIDKR